MKKGYLSKLTLCNFSGAKENEPPNAPNTFYTRRFDMLACLFFFMNVHEMLY
jgi:hypothetical protein